MKKWLKDKKRELIEEEPDLKLDDAWMDVVRVRSKRHCHGDDTWLLHLTASIGDERVLRHLLKTGFGRRQGARAQKGDRQSPLHLVVRRCRNTLHRRGAKAAIEDFQDLVKPILDACPAALDIKNQLGESGALVLEELQGSIASADADRRPKPDVSEDESEDEDRKWKAKLAEEFAYEVEEPMGKFREDWDCEERKETFADFAERIEREYNARYRREHHRPKRKDKAQTGAEPQNRLNRDLKPEKLDEKYEQMKRIMKLKTAKLDYERRWSEFAEKDRDTSWRFDQLPWPVEVREKDRSRDQQVKEMVEVCTWTVNEEDREQERRQQIKRWHPDKVMQKLTIVKEDSQFVFALVKQLVQSLNALKPT